MFSPWARSSTRRYLSPTSVLFRISTRLHGHSGARSHTKIALRHRHHYRKRSNDVASRIQRRAHCSGVTISYAHERAQKMDSLRRRCWKSPLPSLRGILRVRYIVKAMLELQNSSLTVFGSGLFPFSKLSTVHDLSIALGLQDAKSVIRTDSSELLIDGDGRKAFLLLRIPGG